MVTVRSVIVCVASLMVVFGLWKRSQDRGELAFVQEQVRRAKETTARPDLPPEAQQRLAERHREALLAITDKERSLQQSEGSSEAAKALRDRIASEVQKIPGTEKINTSETAWYQFEAEREHDVRVGLVFDWFLIVAGLLALGTVGGRWYREMRGAAGNSSRT